VYAVGMSKKHDELRFAALAVDAVCFRVVDGELEALLGKVVSEGNAFKGRWAHIGGLVRVDETAEDAVERLLRDKAGVADIHKEQLYTFSAIDRDPRGRVVSVAYLALTKLQDCPAVFPNTTWERVSSLPKLAYDHDAITQVALERLRAKILYTDLARYLMPDTFTLSELQRVFEAVLGEGMDKRNFRKRILAAGFLKDTKKTVKHGVMRPAALYAFKA
jgi:8-oxo-dGTP diphosphatase